MTNSIVNGIATASHQLNGAFNAAMLSGKSV